MLSQPNSKDEKSITGRAWGHHALFILGLILASIVGAACFTQFYLALATWLHLTEWVAAALCSSAVALGWWVLRGRLQLANSRISSVSLARALLPAVVILALIVLAATFSRIALPGGRYLPAFHAALTWPMLFWICWIPVVEEIVFRVVLGGIYRKYMGVWLGAYFSALVFSLLHTIPTFDRIMEAQVGLSLGPLLLGVLCELLWIRTRSLTTIIAVHAACNASVPLFLLIDGRWLRWLGTLYQ